MERNIEIIGLYAMYVNINGLSDSFAECDKLFST